MTAALQSEETFRIIVTAAAPMATRVFPSVARHLGIEPDQAADRLLRLPVVLAETVAAADARRIAVILGLFGLKVHLDPVAPGDGPAAMDPRLDISVQLAEGAEPAAALARIALVLGEAVDRAALERPGGLVLTGRAPAERQRLLRALKRIGGLRLAASAPDTALFDLFAPRAPRLLAEVSRLGLAPCRFSGAVAGGINLATGRVLLKRAGPGALLLDRSFQRFDLRLRAAPGLAPAELSAFLDTRPGADHAALRGGAAAAAPRVEADLTRSAAERFVADYAEIGLDVAPKLRGALPESR